MAKSDAANQKILDKAVAKSSMMGYGDDENLVRQAGGPAHDAWFGDFSRYLVALPGSGVPGRRTRGGDGRSELWGWVARRRN